jgi:outer membrane scaffolding protein for murein synthesis (MipA/OmpV family)
LELRYRDLAFASVGDGIGVNVLRGRNYAAGVSITYDLGRKVADDSVHLRGLDDLGRAPVFKLFCTYVVSRSFPLVLRVDLRKTVGGVGGIVGDAGAYLPLPGSSEKLLMFIGSSVTWADHTHEARLFGVTDEEAITSAFPQYDAHAGLQSSGIGLSVTRFFGHHWMVNIDAAENRLLGSARDSPITQEREQHVVSISFAYRW